MDVSPHTPMHPQEEKISFKPRQTPTTRTYINIIFFSFLSRTSILPFKFFPINRNSPFFLSLPYARHTFLFWNLFFFILHLILFPPRTLTSPYLIYTHFLPFFLFLLDIFAHIFSFYMAMATLIIIFYSECEFSRFLSKNTKRKKTGVDAYWTLIEPFFSLFFLYRYERSSFIVFGDLAKFIRTVFICSCAFFASCVNLIKKFIHFASEMNTREMKGLNDLQENKLSRLLKDSNLNCLFVNVTLGVFGETTSFKF